MVLNQRGGSKLRLYSIGASLVILLTNLGIIFFIQEGRFKTILVDLGFPVWYTLASAALFYAARRSALRSRRLAWAWAGLGLAELSFGVGSAIWVYFELFIEPMPFPSLADVFFLFFYPPFLLGILLMPVSRLTWTDWLKTGLDMIIVLLTATLGIWYYWLNPLFAMVGDDSFVLQFVSLAYPVGDLVLVTALLLLLYRQVVGQAATPLFFLAAGTVLMIVSDINYGYQGMFGNDASGTWLDLGWVLSALSHGLAGIWLVTSIQPAETATAARMAAETTAPSKLNTWATYLPYGCAIAAFVMLERIHMQSELTESPWLIWSVGIIISLVLVRQMMTLHENSLLFIQVRNKGAALSQTNQALQETQAMLIHAEKMNALGQLVAGVAHEINNPIAFVNSNIHALKQMMTEVMTAYTHLEQLALSTGTPETKTCIATLRKTSAIDFLREDLGDLVDTSLGGLTRVRKIVDGLRNFSRLDEAEYKWADLREGIESSLLIAQPATKRRIQIELSLNNLPPLYCRPAELNQVFLNLILNAAHAITDKGTITIAGHDTEHEVVLTFCDTGCGMSAEVMQQIFNPFFTTKPVGIGTGLGLTIAYKIITAGHGGTIKVASERGRGTTFTIRLPKENPL